MFILVCSHVLISGEVIKPMVVLRIPQILHGTKPAKRCYSASAPGRTHSFCSHTTLEQCLGTRLYASLLARVAQRTRDAPRRTSLLTGPAAETLDKAELANRLTPLKRRGSESSQPSPVRPGGRLPIPHRMWQKAEG